MSDPPYRLTCDVDVIIPVYNGEKYIVEALSSVVLQTCKPKRIIVVDDGSTDSTESVVRSYNSPVPISYVRKENGGPGSARNVGIRESDSCFIAFLDADDLWEPDKLQTQVSLFENNARSELGAVYCNSGFISADGAPVKSASLSYRRVQGQVFDKLISGNITRSGSEVMVKRACFEEVGLFDESLWPCPVEDWDMLLRIATSFEFDCVDENLVKIRTHGSNISKNLRRMIEGRILVLSKLLDSYPNSEVVLQELRYHVLRLMLHKRFRQVIPDIRRLLAPGLRRRVFLSPGGLVRAAWKGFKKFRQTGAVRSDIMEIA